MRNKPATESDSCKHWNSHGRKLVSDFLQEIARNVYGGQCRYILQPDDHSFMSFDTDQLSFDTFELPLRHAHPVAGT